MATTTLRFTRVSDVMCLVHGEREPSVEDWQTYVDGLAIAMKEHGVRRLIVVSRGGGPNAAQRKVLLTGIGERAKDLTTAVCSSSALARGITTALGWISAASITGFAYDDRRRALDFLGVPVSQHAEVLAAVDANITALATS